jgi:hypothetical protein
MAEPNNNTNEYIDKITLQFLTSKAQYNKYLSTSDPKKFEEQQTHLGKIAKYSNVIMSMTEEYCANPNKQRTNEMDEAFNNYVRTCIKYLEMKEMEGSCDHEYGNRDVEIENDEDEVLFGETRPVHTFWGKGAKKFGT